MPSDEVTIRAIQPADIEPVAELLAALATEFITWEFEPAARERFLEKNNAPAIRDFLLRNYRYHVAEHGGDLVGFVGVRDNTHLYHLFVAKHAQGRGIGRELWEFAKRDCTANGHKGAFTVNASNNAVSIYERFGFIRDGAAQNSNGVIYNPMKLEN